MRVLITGVAGFIGSHLADYCLEAGWDVVGVDNLSTGSMRNIDHICDNPKFKFYLLSLEKPTLELAFRGAPFSFIFHQGALGSVPRSIDDPIATYESNVIGTLNLFNMAVKHGAGKVVYASSSSIYGDCPNALREENKVGVTAMSPYAASKRSCEDIAKTFYCVHGLRSVGLRYFNVYGPRQNAQGAYATVIPKWINLMERGEPCEIYGDGQQTRDFTYIKDVVRANMKAARAVNAIDGFAFNIGVGDQNSLIQVFQLLSQKYTGSALSFGPKRKGDALRSYAYTHLAWKILAFKAEFNLKQGLEDMLCGETK